MWSKPITKEEKNLVKAIVKLHFAKGWDKPSEYELYCLYDISDRDELEKLIDKLWNEVNA